MHIAPDDVEASIVRPKHPHSQVHAKSGVVGSGKAAEDKQYFHAIAEALKGAEEILVVGPAQAQAAAHQALAQPRPAGGQQGGGCGN